MAGWPACASHALVGSLNDVRKVGLPRPCLDVPHHDGPTLIPTDCLHIGGDIVRSMVPAAMTWTSATANTTGTLKHKLRVAKQALVLHHTQVGCVWVPGPRSKRACASWCSKQGSLCSHHKDNQESTISPRPALSLRADMLRYLVDPLMARGRASPQGRQGCKEPPRRAPCALSCHPTRTCAATPQDGVRP